MYVNSYNTNEYILICTDLRSADIAKKLPKFQKRASPLSPGTRERVRLVSKNETLRHAIRETGSYDFVFVPGHHPRFETYTNPFPCHTANPLLGR